MSKPPDKLSDDIDMLHRWFPPAKPAPQLPLKFTESKTNRDVLYRKMVQEEWTDASGKLNQGTCSEGESAFDFRTAFKYHTGNHARVWASTSPHKAREFQNQAAGGSDYVLVQFVFNKDLAEVFKGNILPQKKTGAQHNNNMVLMHREGFEPFHYGKLLVKDFTSQEEVSATIELRRDFDLGYSAQHADKLNTHLIFARLR